MVQCSYDLKYVGSEYCNSVWSQKSSIISAILSVDRD